MLLLLYICLKRVCLIYEYIGIHRISNEGEAPQQQNGITRIDEHYKQAKLFTYNIMERANFASR